MIPQSQSENINLKNVKDDAQRLIDAHLVFDSPSKGVVGDRLYPREALQAAIVTATQLTKETAKSHWYKVLTYLEDKQQILYGKNRNTE
jgi:hypothetical protein